MPSFNEVKGSDISHNIINDAVHQINYMNIQLSGPSTDSLQHQKLPPSIKIPPAPSTIYGRDAVINQAVSSIKSGIDAQQPNRLAILGPGGIGKTTVGLAILHHEGIVAHFQNRRYFLSCEAITTANSLLGCIHKSLGAKQGQDSRASLHEFFRASPPLVLLLDNFETPWHESSAQDDVELILKDIDEIPHVTLIITMRGSVSPSGILWTIPDIILPVLTLDAAKNLFLATNPKTVSRQLDNLELLLNELDCVPLAVKLVAQLGKTPGQTPSVLLRRWRKIKTDLIKTQSDVKAGRLTSVARSIDLSLSSSIIVDNNKAKEFLALLALLPAGLLDWNQKLDNTDFGFVDPHGAVAILLELALVYEVDEHLLMLSPIRHHIAEKYKPNDSHLEILRKYYTKLMLPHPENGVQPIPDLLSFTDRELAAGHHPLAELLNAASVLAPAHENTASFIRPFLSSIRIADSSIMQKILDPDISGAEIIEIARSMNLQSTNTSPQNVLEFVESTLTFLPTIKEQWSGDELIALEAIEAKMKYVAEYLEGLLPLL